MCFLQLKENFLRLKENHWLNCFFMVRQNFFERRKMFLIGKKEFCSLFTEKFPFKKSLELKLYVTRKKLYFKKIAHANK